MSLRLRAAAATDVGNLRDNNQDDLLVVDDALFVVADGMGGHVAGEVASREAVDAMRSAYARPGSSEDLRQAVRDANAAVWQRGTADPSYRGMGTTVTAVGVVDGDRLAVVNVGDSRTYLLRDGELIQLTEDHSFVQEAVRSGQLTQPQAESHPRRSQLTRALGVAADVEVDVEVLEPRTGDRLLLCSDGLWDEVGDDAITMVLTNHATPEEAAAQLVLWAKEAGGRDNITVIVLDVVDGGEGERGRTASADLAAAGEAPTAVSPAVEADVAGFRHEPEPWHPPAAPTEDRSLMQPAPTAPVARRSGLLTWRVVAFFVVLAGVLGVATVLVLRSGPVWSVALDGNDVVVKEGDAIRERKQLQVNQLPASVRNELAQGRRVADQADADRYVDGITRQAIAEGTLGIGAGVVVTTTTSTAAAATIVTTPTTAGTSTTLVGP